MRNADTNGGLQQPALAPAAVASLSAELAALEMLQHDELRIQWRNRFGKTAPARLSRSLLLRLLAYRMQAEAFGDLDRDALRLFDRLDRAGNGTEGGRPPPRQSGLNPCLKPGTLLAREWRGRLERVMVLEQGFAWNGTTYPSLSAAACAITSTKWNGHRFFGLRDRKEAAGQGKRAVVRPLAESAYQESASRSEAGR
jgi:hypothetical protein